MRVLVGNPEPITELPENWKPIRNRNQWGYIAEEEDGSLGRRVVNGRYFDTIEEAKESALDRLNSDTGFSSNQKPGTGSWPKVISKKDGIEYRQTNRKLKYVAKTPGGSIRRDANGTAIMMDEDEIESSGLPKFERTIAAFDGDKPIGYVADEWGVPGIWVVNDYQRKGIALKLLDLYAEQGEEMGSTRYSLSDSGSMGQSTTAGYRLVEKYHELLVQRALDEGKPVPKDVLNDYPRLQRRSQNAS